MSRSNGEEVFTPDTAGTPLGDLKRDAFDAMSEEEQEFLLAEAQEFIDILTDAENLLARKHAAQRFDVEEGLAFWSLLPAKVRTAIKRGKA